MTRALTLTVTLLCALLLALAGAVGVPHRDLSPQQEARAQRVGDSLRCPVCRGLPITESPNDLSAQMLREVRDQVALGRSDDQIRAYFTTRFGDTVLLDPPRRGVTLLLWLLPLAALVFGAAALVRYLRSAARAPDAPDAALLARVERDLATRKDLS